MIQIRSRLDVADNTGARMATMIGVIGKGTAQVARIGDVITANVKEASATGTVKKGDVVRAVVVRTKQPIRREDGSLPALRQQRHRHHRQGPQSARHPHLRPGRARTARTEFHEDCFPGTRSFMNRIKLHVKKGDHVEVISGNFRGSTGKILQVLPKKNRVLIEGVRLIKKHLRKSQDNPSGKIAEREGPIHISNVKLVEREKETKKKSKTKATKKTKKEE